MVEAALDIGSETLIYTTVGMFRVGRSLFQNFILATTTTLILMF